MRARTLSHPTRHLLVAAAITPALWLAAASAARAQGGVSKIDRDNAMRKADTERELEMRARDGEAKSAEITPQQRLALEQIGEDFRRMQIVNNELMRATFPRDAPPALDYARISKAASEINRRASRLKLNLQLPPAGDGRAADRDVANDRELRASLLALDDLIMGFVNNPTFRAQGLLDARHSARANRDLASIIRLSRLIKQRAEKLKG